MDSRVDVGDRQLDLLVYDDVGDIPDRIGARRVHLRAVSRGTGSPLEHVRPDRALGRFGRDSDYSIVRETTADFCPPTARFWRHVWGISLPPSLPVGSGHVRAHGAVGHDVSTGRATV